MASFSVFKKIIVAIFFLCAIYCLNYLNDGFTKPLLKISNQEASTNFHESFLKVATLGYRRLASSFLWIQTLLESDIEHYKSDDLNSWMFRRFNTISSLDPRFYENYLFGGQYLSIIKDDDVGAKFIYARGLNRFPDDFWLNYHSAFHDYFELGELDSAYEKYNKIKFHPIAKERAPYLPSLTARLLVEKNMTEDAFNLLLTSFNRTPDKSPLKMKLKLSLYALKAERDLNCLNSQKHINECNRFDFEGAPYIKNGNSYAAPKAWTPFKIKKAPK